MDWFNNSLQDWWSNQYLSNFWNGYGGEMDQFNLPQGFPPIDYQAENNAFPTFRSQWLFGQPDGLSNGFPPDPSNPFMMNGNNDPGQEGDNKPKPTKGSLKDIDSTLGKFATEYSTAHGLPNIYLAQSVFARIFWTLIFLGALGGYIYTMQNLLTTFFEFNVATEVEIFTKAALDFPAVTVCNTNRVRRSQVLQSRHKQLIFIDDLTPLPYYVPCESGDFMCANGILCVRSYLMCDGINHCEDYSDEQGCNYGNCGPTQFKCNLGSHDGYCIPNNLECNRWPDCYDGEDEWDCECKENEFKCVERGGCIKKAETCDGNFDCLDNSDELNCPNCTAGVDSFICGTTENNTPTGARARDCIWSIFVCDGFSDCPDESDESEYACSIAPTPPPPSCKEDEYDCGNGQCIDINYLCDNNPDCNNAMDESTETCGERVIRCADNEFMCPNGYQCLHSDDSCNFVSECANDVHHSDERNCTCRSYNGEEPRQRLNCNGYISESAEVNWELEDNTVVSCHHENWPADETLTWYQEYACGGQLTCEDLETELPETCTTGFTDCYVNSNGADYKGRVRTTMYGDCVPWNTELAADYGYTEDRFPLLGNHDFCRNPGGFKTAPWCFIVENGNYINGVEAPVEVFNTVEDNTGGNGDETGENGLFTTATVSLDQSFNDALNDLGSPQSETLAMQFELEMNTRLGNEFGSDVDSSQVIEFSEGSVVVDFVIFWVNSVDSFLIETFLNEMTNDGFIVDLPLVRGSSQTEDNNDNMNVDCGPNFECGDGECLPMAFRCDGFEDCVTGRDEISSLCGGNDDMTNDECGLDEFLCGPDEECIFRQLVCDGEENCNNGRDESPTECEGGTGDMTNDECGLDRFSCGPDEECISRQLVCDGEENCNNGRDESPTECEGGTGDMTNDECGLDRFSCGPDEECISRQLVCDGEENCNNGRDESPTECEGGTGDMTNDECGLGEFLCGPVEECISRQLVCDGEENCNNGRDESPTECEEGNNDMTDDGCGPDEFLCGLVQGCISRQLVCDGFMNCNNGLDESPTECEEAQRKKRNISNQIKARRRKRKINDIIKGHIRRRKRQTEAGQGTQWEYCTVPTDDQKLTCHQGVSFEDVRLQNGKLEIHTHGQWGTVSEPSWDESEANVLCRMLGLGTATSATVGVNGGNQGPVWISNIDCIGDEITLLDCVYTSNDGSEDHLYDVGATCSGSGRKKRETGNLEIIEQDMFAKPNDRLRRQEPGRDYNLENYYGTGSRPPIEFDFADDDPLDMLVDGNVGTFQCGQTGEIIPLWKTCNNYPDCEDGSDEIYCGPREQLCDLHFRPCRLSDTCIGTGYECDGYDDCLYGTDEAFCAITECPDNYWKCPSKPICIPLYNRCDTVDDCGNKEDEENCTNIESAVPPNPFEDPNWFSPYSGYAGKDFFEVFEKEYYQPRFFHRVKGEEPVDWKSFFTYSTTADYSDLLEVFKITRAEIADYGHQYEDFILECTYDQDDCTDDFTWFETDTYGNCYTFNFNPGEHIVSTQTGATYGLRMTLNLQQEEYISLGGREAGVRVTITPPDVRPIPDEDGITIRPGVVSSIGLRFENISRLGGRYGDCAGPERKMNIFDKGEIKQSDTEAYDRQVCLRTCLHQNILEHCECSDTIQLKGPRCHVSNTTQDLCKQVIRVLHQSDKLKCDCPNQCKTKTYAKTTSTSKWPSNVYKDHLLRFIHAINPNATVNINDQTSIDDNLVRLEVFFEQLNYATTKEVPAYTVPSLFSDVGGTAGLYIGFSLITFLEFGVLFLELIKRFCLRSKAGRGLPFRRRAWRWRQEPQQLPPGFFPQQFPEQFPMAFQQQYGMSMF